MIFLSWTRPSPSQQKACIDKSGSLNYNLNYKGATNKFQSAFHEDNQLAREGFLLNHSRVLLGSGSDTYEKGKSALQSWRHFQMPWTFVESTTPVKSGRKLCVCVKEFFPWLLMPLQILYVDEKKAAKREVIKASYSFGSGTLQGHLLAGEERFLVELDEDDKVWHITISTCSSLNLSSKSGEFFMF
ncbi:hypothetical protein V2J09_003996 [Rumex salicifolius]